MGVDFYNLWNLRNLRMNKMQTRNDFDYASIENRNRTEPTSIIS